MSNLDQPHGTNSLAFAVELLAAGELAIGSAVGVLARPVVSSPWLWVVLTVCAVTLPWAGIRISLAIERRDPPRWRRITRRRYLLLRALAIIVLVAGGAATWIWSAPSAGFVAGGVLIAAAVASACNSFASTPVPG